MSNYHLKDSSLSLSAKGLLSVMLSLPDTWDYTEKGLCSITGTGQAAIRSCLKQLEENHYLVRRRIRDEKGLLRGTEYVIYEHPMMAEQDSCGSEPDCENPNLDNPNLDSPTLDAPNMEGPNLAQPVLENPGYDAPGLDNRPQLNTDSSNTDKANTDINQSTHQQTRDDRLMDGSGTSARKYEACRDVIRDNIGYDIFCQKAAQLEARFDNGLIDIDDYREQSAIYNIETLDRVVQYITDFLCSDSIQPVSINGNPIPREVVRSKLLKTSHFQMKSVLLALNTKTDIANPKNYAISMLYNA